MVSMTSTLPPRIPPRSTPRVVEHDEAVPVPWWTRVSARIPRHTVRGALAGAEAALGSWLVVAVVAVAGYVATASAPELGSAGWIDAARAGSAIWLLAHGGGLQLGAITVTLVPLGVTLLALGAVAGATRRARVEAWWALVAGTAVYTLLAGVFALFAAAPGSWRGVIGAALVGGLGSFLGLRGTSPRLPRPASALLARLPRAVGTGVRAGGRAALVLLAAGTVIVVIAMVVGFSRVLDVHRALIPDAASTVILVLAQLLLLPTLVVWGTSFVTGPGFAVGEGTSFAPTGVEAGPLPVVPVLGALPEPGSAPGWMVALVAVGVLAGAIAGHRVRRAGAGLIGTTVAVALAALTAAAALAGLAWLCSGSIGPDRMSVIGPDPLAVGIAVVWQVALGAALVALPSHPTSRAGARRAVAAAGRWWEQVRGPQG